MTRGMGQKKVLGFKHNFTSMGKCKEVTFNTFKWIFILELKFHECFKFLKQGLKKQILSTKVYFKCWKGLEK
jgi:hypothetical protein